jgi:outer membrane immunogenic protein
MRREAKMLPVLGALVALTSTAFAADLPRPVYKAAPFAPEPVFTWTGFYVGGHLGYGWSKFSVNDPVLGASSNTASGWLGGAQAGYNYQIGSFVLGVEGDYSFADVKKTATVVGGNGTLKNDFFADVTARAGYAFDRFLVYGKGGIAWTRDKLNVSLLGGTASGTFNRTGWLLGGGLEWAFMNNWSAKIEYNYLHFNSITENFATTGGLTTSCPCSVGLNTQIVKAGVNYRF